MIVHSDNDSEGNNDSGDGSGSDNDSISDDGNDSNGDCDSDTDNDGDSDSDSVGNSDGDGDSGSDSESLLASGCPYRRYSAFDVTLNFPMVSITRRDGGEGTYCKRAKTQRQVCTETADAPANKYRECDGATPLSINGGR
ncbi:hypothetical protein KIN20_036144 [Parelaphostrongylus tenuis]|uniref:Uncharacterized protein n=1 Tax=Parelaphostrongylus tenuis TaxID=148309 RepID=A0AAD5WKF9_PARTN|nr:hypothetical protein KIN20_036143 [Parelaphostrongylus tenuis]KAJ1373673.1 hypothetical protein KIN20_036144 [Parelaphostrongylus tenuis]